MTLHCGENAFHGFEKVVLTRPAPGSALEWFLLGQEFTQKIATARGAAEAAAKRACSAKCEGRRQEGGPPCKAKRAYWSVKPVLFSFKYDPAGPVRQGKKIRHEVQVMGAAYWRAWVFCEPAEDDFHTPKTAKDGSEAAWDDAPDGFPAVPYWD